ncbi:alpha/beta fold hydrolase [Pararhizobium antarcticum]|uniref:Esterase n=1 Tax=Pararhizobium antarcticum TaxID=1798805 RepID=A0A657LWZ1_9HYPH|nr:alpha/beta hydrolase [Pararhizobium antarcticum]OJF89786.1 esterase [Rhizobium sp. 58]OJF99735.1 esterase [Pararhizobium antarcticum]
MVATASLTQDSVQLAVHDHGHGLPVVFQHGLGGDAAQVAQTFPETGGLRRITAECRGHGASRLGGTRPFSIRMFAEDVFDAARSRGIMRPVIGGISMGAAIALHLAHHHAGSIAALILVRPAWTFDPEPANMAPIRTIASLLKDHAPEEARRLFAASETAAELRANAPDNYASLLGYFDRPDATAFASVLADIAADGPGVSEAEAAALAIPTLVIGNSQDAIHPLASARTVAQTIRAATFVEVEPKATDKVRHFAEIRAAISHFLASETIRSSVSS